MMLKKLRSVLFFIICPMVYAASPGWYGGAIGNIGGLYNTYESVHRISANRAGLFTPTCKLWDMSYVRYQHSNRFAVIVMPRLYFSTATELTFLTSQGDIHGYSAYLMDVVGAFHLFRLKRHINLEGQFGLWGAQSDATMITQGDTQKRSYPIPGYGAVIGLGVHGEFLPRFLVEASYKGLWSFSRMASVMVTQVGISYRLV